MSTMNDVRDFLMKQLKELADSDATPEEMALKIERAKASSMVAGTFIASVKCEIDAIETAHETGKLAGAVAQPQPLRIVNGGRS